MPALSLLSGFPQLNYGLLPVIEAAFCVDIKRLKVHLQETLGICSLSIHSLKTYDSGRHTEFLAAENC